MIFDEEHEEAITHLLNNEWISPRIVAEILEVSDSTVRRWVSEGRLKGIRVGGGIRVSRVDLGRFIVNQQELVGDDDA